MKQLVTKGAGKTDVGRVRATNQDAFLANNEAKLYLVADGMGGHAGGEIASRLAVDTIEAQICKNLQIFELDPLEANHEFQILKTMEASVNFASAKIYEHALEDPSLRGMGTTATVVKISGKHAYWAHVGDSRLYLLRNRFLYQLTFDHSLVNEQVRAGILTPEEAEVHHLKNVITRSVGYQEEEDVDSASILIQTGDKLILCSDGLHGKVSDSEIASIVDELGLDSLDTLVDLANSRGGDDNITILVVSLDS